jgi:hypothetical protein
MQVYEVYIMYVFRVMYCHMMECDYRRASD